MEVQKEGKPANRTLDEDSETKLDKNKKTTKKVKPKW